MGANVDLVNLVSGTDCVSTVPPNFGVRHSGGTSKMSVGGGNPRVFLQVSTPWPMAVACRVDLTHTVPTKSISPNQNAKTCQNPAMMNCPRGTPFRMFGLNLITALERQLASPVGDILKGGASNDVLHGNDGHDTLNGLAGNNTLNGGGSDTADYSGSGAGVTVNLSTNSNSGGHASGDTFSGFETLTGSAHADTLTGDASANVLKGGGGDDTLVGLGGADSMDGGAGTDTADYSTSPETVLYHINTGTVSGGHAQGDTLTSIEEFSGTVADQTIPPPVNPGVAVSPTQSNVFVLSWDNPGGVQRTYAYQFREPGETWADTWTDFTTTTLSPDQTRVTGSLTGLACGVTYEIRVRAEVPGNPGNPSDEVDVTPGAGDSTEGNDRLTSGSAADCLAGLGGHDIVDYSASNAGVTVNLLTSTGSGGHADGDSYHGISNVHGSYHNDRLTGDHRNNTHRGGPGNDVLVGLGDSLYPGDDEGGATSNDGLWQSKCCGAGDLLDGGPGNDTIDYSAAPRSVSVDLSLACQTSGHHAWGDVLVGIENVTGSRYGDRLTSGFGNNVLRGQGGNDTLNGTFGQDTFEFGRWAGVAE